MGTKAPAVMLVSGLTGHQEKAVRAGPSCPCSAARLGSAGWRAGAGSRGTSEEGREHCVCRGEASWEVSPRTSPPGRWGCPG